MTPGPKGSGLGGDESLPGGVGLESQGLGPGACGPLIGGGLEGGIVDLGKLYLGDLGQLTSAPGALLQLASPNAFMRYGFTFEGALAVSRLGRGPASWHSKRPAHEACAVPAAEPL